MTNYSMTPINNGTRLREDHNTFAPVITSYNRGQKIVGDQIWEAPADGTEVKKGDKWIRVTHVDEVELTRKGWMAYIHKGEDICKDFHEISDEVPPPTSPVFPESFVLTDPGGAKAEYVFVRILED